MERDPGGLPGEPGVDVESADFVVWFRRLYAASYRAALRLVGDADLADEVSSETLARALVAWDRLTEGGHYEPWVLRVTSNVAIDLLRRRKRWQLAGDVLAVVQGRVVTTEGVVSRLDLVGMLRRLPRRQREVLVMRYILDLSEADVADALGLALGTVKKAAARGLGALRAVLAEDDNGEVNFAVEHR